MCKKMLRVSAVLLFAARCAAFGTLPFSGPGGSCVDEPAHRVADETAKMGEPFAQLKRTLSVNFVDFELFNRESK